MSSAARREYCGGWRGGIRESFPDPSPRRRRHGLSRHKPTLSQDSPHRFAASGAMKVGPVTVLRVYGSPRVEPSRYALSARAHAHLPAGIFSTFCPVGCTTVTCANGPPDDPRGRSCGQLVANLTRTTCRRHRRPPLRVTGSRPSRGIRRRRSAGRLRFYIGGSACLPLRTGGAPTQGWTSPHAIWANGSSSTSCQSV
jgi:hypothetical protein